MITQEFRYQTNMHQFLYPSGRNPRITLRTFASNLFKFPHLFPRPNRFVRARWVSKSKVGSLVASEVSSHAATPFRSNARCKKGQLVNRSWPNHMLQSPPWHLLVWMRKPAWYVFANKLALKFKPYEGAMNEIEWTPGPSLLYWFSRVAGFLLPKRLWDAALQHDNLVVRMALLCLGQTSNRGVSKKGICKWKWHASLQQMSTDHHSSLN